MIQSENRRENHHHVGQVLLSIRSMSQHRGELSDQYVLPASALDPPEEHVLLKSGMSREKPRRLVGNLIHHNLVSLDDSTMNEKQDHYVDHGLLKSRSFRVGWGPNWTLSFGSSHLASMGAAVMVFVMFLS